jgi:hypothetical protein
MQGEGKLGEEGKHEGGGREDLRNSRMPDAKSPEATWSAARPLFWIHWAEAGTPGGRATKGAETSGAPPRGWTVSGGSSRSCIYKKIQIRSTE